MRGSNSLAPAQAAELFLQVVRGVNGTVAYQVVRKGRGRREVLSPPLEWADALDRIADIEREDSNGHSGIQRGRW